jgi:hypothetical protein
MATRADPAFEVTGESMRKETDDDIWFVVAYDDGHLS